MGLLYVGCMRVVSTKCFLVVGLVWSLGVSAWACPGLGHLWHAVDTKGSAAAQVCFDRAKVEAGKGNHDGAIAEYSKAIEVSPNYCSAYNNRGIQRRHTGDIQGALADHRHAVELEPFSAIPNYNLGEDYFSVGDLRAINNFDVAVSCDPNYQEAYLERAIVRLDLGNRAGALIDCNQAVRLKPDDGQAYVRRAYVRYYTRDYLGAISDYDRAIKINPMDDNAFYSCAYAQRALGRVSEAIVDLDSAIKINSHFAAAYNYRGQLFLEIGQIQNAIADLDRSVFLESGTSSFYLKRANARMTLKLPGDFYGTLMDYAMGWALTGKEVVGADLSSLQNLVLRFIEGTGVFRLHRM